MADEDYIALGELEKGLSNLVGQERAQEIIKEAKTACGVAEKPLYGREEVTNMVNHIKDQGGMLAVIVSAISVRLLIRT